MHNSAYYIDVIFVTKMLLQIKFHLFVFQNFSCYNNFQFFVTELRFIEIASWNRVQCTISWISNFALSLNGSIQI